MKKIIVMMGLPGAGKTTLAKEIQQRDKRKTHIWDLDRFIRSQYDLKNYSVVDELNFSTRFLKEFQKQFIYNNNIHVHILDGLFLNNNGCERLIKELSIIEVLKPNVTIEFCYFEPDKEACLWNDMARGRNKKAMVTINNAVVERPDVSILEKLTDAKISVVDYQTTRAADKEVYYQSFKDEFDIYKDKFHGDAWSKGGNWCDCWGNDSPCSEEDDPEFSPENFPELRMLLNCIIPNIDLELELELFNSTVQYDEYDESDYYGGTQCFKRFECDIRKLYDLLDEREMLVLSRLMRD